MKPDVVSCREEEQNRTLPPGRGIDVKVKGVWVLALATPVLLMEGWIIAKDTGCPFVNDYR